MSFTQNCPRYDPNFAPLAYTKIVEIKRNSSRRRVFEISRVVFEDVLFSKIDQNIPKAYFFRNTLQSVLAVAAVSLSNSFDTSYKAKTLITVRKYFGNKVKSH